MWHFVHDPQPALLVLKQSLREKTGQESGREFSYSYTEQPPSWSSELSCGTDMKHLQVRFQHIFKQLEDSKKGLVLLNLKKNVK